MARPQHKKFALVLRDHEVCRTGKITYSRRSAAMRAVRQQRDYGRLLTEENVYQCETCGGWHIGRTRKQIRGL